MHLKKTSLISIYLTFAIDNLSATIVYPVFAPLFLNPQDSPLSEAIPFHYRSILLGLFLAAFPLSQFFCSPIIGDYSDQRGRRKAFLITTFMTFLGYLLAAISIHVSSLVFLFIGRLLMGVGAANLTICLSSLTDLSSANHTRGKYYRIGSAIAGSTFVLGPFMGGKLSDPAVISWFSPQLPMVVGSVFALMNFGFIFFFFSETAKVTEEAKFDWLRGLHHVGLAFFNENVRRIFIIYFSYLLAWTIFFQFLPAIFIRNYHLTNSAVGNVCALLGLSWIFGTALINHLLIKLFSIRSIMVVSLLIFSFFCLLLSLSLHMGNALVYAAIATIISGLIWPLCTQKISESVDFSLRGKVMGMSQSLLSLTMMIGAILGGVFLGLQEGIPFRIAATSAFCSALFALLLPKPQ